MLSRAGIVSVGFAACLGALVTSCKSDGATSPFEGVVLTVTGAGAIANRFTAEISVGGRYAYSSSWGTRNGTRGNAVYVWDLTVPNPLLVDSVIVSDAAQTGDVQAVVDAKLLVVAVEPAPHGAIVFYDLADPAHPQFIARYETPSTVNGVHTAQVSRVGDRLYAFLAIDPREGEPAKLVIVDITDPRAPAERWVKVLGAPFIHDVNVRDGILLTAEWNDGLAAYDIGGGGRGGSPSSPVFLGRVLTKGGSAHNVYWLRDAESGARYAIVGEEGPGAVGSSSVGDIHVVDVSSWSAMREVAYFTVDKAGTHNFWVDESQGVLYAAYYNAGVRALDIRGALGTCTTAARDDLGRCDLERAGRLISGALVDAKAYVWGVDGASGSLIASDMLHGIWRISLAKRR